MTSARSLTVQGVAALSPTIVACTLVLAMPALATPLRAAPAEVRGTWLTTTGPDQIASGLNTAAVTRDLRSIGLNTVYVETWKNGYTNFPSSRLAGLTGGPDRSTFLGTARDLVQETLIQAHRNQMAYIGWFEYGFAAQFVGAGGSPSNPLGRYMQNRGWLLQNRSGQYADGSNGFAWMNPAVPEVRQFLIDVTLEAVNRYDLDGIQFDDRLAWPVQFGFDATTISLYRQETGRPPPTSATDAPFSQWRQEKVTEFATQLYQAVKAVRPELLVSVAPSITTFSTTNYNANWPAWEAAGLFDEYAIQAYRNSLSAYNSILGAQAAPFKPDDLEKLVIGLRINGSGDPTPYADLEAMIDRARNEGAAGHSLWYGAGVRDLYRSQLTAFYDVAGTGQAANPHFASDHRPAPLVGSLAPGSTSDWTVNVDNGGRYRVVAQAGSFWREIAAVELAAGAHIFPVVGAGQLELLVDRRTDRTFLGDFNSDGKVDGADLLAWQRGLKTADPKPTDGDANHDGRVNAADLTAWRWNAVTRLLGEPPALVVPEAASSVLAAAALAAVAAPYRRGRLRRTSGHIAPCSWKRVP